MPRGQHSQQDSPCDDQHCESDQSSLGKGQVFIILAPLGPLQTEDQRLEADTPSCVGPSGKLAPKESPQGKGCLPDSHVKPGEGHQGAATSRLTFHCCTATLCLPHGITAWPLLQRPRAPSGDISFSELKPGAWVTSLQQTCVNSSNLFTEKMYESHEGLDCRVDSVWQCSPTEILWRTYCVFLNLGSDSCACDILQFS